jgi:DNA polymerase III alpha subunit
MAFMDIEDVYGLVEILVFPKVYERVGHEIADDKIVLAKGRISAREDEDAKFILDDIMEISQSLRSDENGAAHSGDHIDTVYSENYGKLRQWAHSEYGGNGRYGMSRTEYRNGSGSNYADTRNGGGYTGTNGSGYAGTSSGGSINTNGGYPYEMNGEYINPPPANGMDHNGPGGNAEMSLYIKLNGDENKQALDSAYATLRFFSGRTPVVLYNGTNKTRKNLGKEYWIKPSETLFAELRERFGVDNVVLR